MNNNEYENRITDMNSLELIDLNDYESIDQFKQQQQKELNKMFKETEELANSIENKYLNRLLGSLVAYYCGDAKGVPYEFTKRDQLKTIPHEMVGNQGAHNQEVGTFSDDTSTTLATMNSININQGINYDSIMSEMNEWYTNAKYTANNKVFDIGITTKRALDNYKRGIKATNCGMKSSDSNGNGSLMRMLPIAIIFSTETMSNQEEVETVYYTSGLTHAHEISLAGCKIYCDIIKELSDGSSMQEALNTIRDNDYDKYYDESTYLYSNILNGNIEKMKEDEIKSSGYIVDTLEASIWATLNSNSIEEAIQKAIQLGGDTDTIAAITGSFAGMIYGFENIPKDWIKDLKNIECLSDITNSFIKTIKLIKKNIKKTK